MVDDAHIPLNFQATDLFSLFTIWGQAFLRLLDDYGAMIHFHPALVHQIDPRRFCPTIHNQLLEAFCQSPELQRHDIVRTGSNVADFYNIPEHRRLQRHESDDDDYALCHFDKRRNAVFTVDASPGAMPRLHCQEIGTDHRLMPIIENEFVDNVNPIWAQGAAMSEGVDYLVIYYVWEESRESYITYIVVWLID